jgi:hypothetical protein
MGPCFRRDDSDEFALQIRPPSRIDGIVGRCILVAMLRTKFNGVRLARMSSGTWCLVRDLGLVKGGKGMRHFEPLVTFSVRAFARYVRGLSARHAADHERLPGEVQDLG